MNNGREPNTMSFPLLWLRWWCVLWVVVVVVVIVVRTLCLCDVSVHATQLMQLIRVAERLGASSWRPHHPVPTLMAFVNPGRVPLYTALTTPYELIIALMSCHTPVDELQLRNVDNPLRWPTRARQQPCPRASTNCRDSTVCCTVSTIRHLSLHNDGY